MQLKSLEVTTLLGWVLLLVCTLYLIRYVWRRRWLYYHASKVDGPFAWPIIGAGYHFIGGQPAFYDNIVRLLQTNPEVFKLWVGSEVYFFSSRPQDVEIALGTFLEKTYFYTFGDDCFKNGLIYSPVSVWKGRRKMINQSFNLKLVNSFQGIFAKHATVLVKELEKYRGNDEVDLIPKLWKCTLQIFFETLIDVDSDLISGVEQYMEDIHRFEQLTVARVCNPLVHQNFFYYLSPLGKLGKDLSTKSWKFIKQLVNVRRTTKIKYDDDEDDMNRKRFMNLLIEAKHLKDDDVLAETHNMIIAATETTAVTLGAAMFLLSINQDVQNKVIEELDSIFVNDERDPTLDDVNKMQYLDRVLKETLRFFPVLPIILRHIDEDIVTDSYVIPAGSCFLAPIAHIQRRPDLWPDPMKFDPDRFLPGELEKKHRCAYIPFSYGARNCIGSVYAMLSMKTILTAILRRYVINPGPYKAIEEVELVYSILGKPKIGWKFSLEERAKITS